MKKTNGIGKAIIYLDYSILRKISVAYKIDNKVLISLLLHLLLQKRMKTTGNIVPDSDVLQNRMK